MDPMDRFRWRVGDVELIGQAVDLDLSLDNAWLLRGILLDFAETFSDEPAEADRAALAARVAAAIEEALR